MPHYTTGSKITEESEELVDALREYLKKPSFENLVCLKEEVADVIITAAVAAHQCGFTVEEALDHKIQKDRGRREGKDIQGVLTYQETAALTQSTRS